MGKLADEVGLDVLALGEHHRSDFIISAPEVVLAAVAAIIKRIRLSSVVTVLSPVDPGRTIQNFATVNLISNGRAEIITVLFAAHEPHWSRARLVAHGPPPFRLPLRPAGAVAGRFFAGYYCQATLSISTLQ